MTIREALDKAHAVKSVEEAEAFIDETRAIVLHELGPEEMKASDEGRIIAMLSILDAAVLSGEYRKFQEGGGRWFQEYAKQRALLHGSKKNFDEVPG